MVQGTYAIAQDGPAAHHGTFEPSEPSPTASVPFDLFVSYAEANAAWVEGFLLDALEAAGVSYRSRATFQLGAPTLTEFERAVAQSRRTLLVLTPAYFAQDFSQFADLLAQQYGLETATWPVIPLVLEPVDLPPRLRLLERLDATRPDTRQIAVARLCAELNKPVPGPDPVPACPYPGLLPFAETDADRFFGREASVRDLLLRLRLEHVLAVIGPSGCGKSSLVFAGLLPALQRSSLFGDGDWLIRKLRPGATPQRALTAQLTGDLTSMDQAVRDTLAGEPRARRLLLVVDQLEELFTYPTATPSNEAQAFCEAIHALSLNPDCWLVVTIRSDFYEELMLSPLWTDIHAHRVEVLPPSPDELRDAIVRPAAQAGVFVDAALTDRLIADAGGEPGTLPLVQETLALLWDRLERRYLPFSAYAQLGQEARMSDANAQRGGLQVALSLRADAVIAELLRERQKLARRIFLRLVQFGEGRADTRRQQSLDQLRSVADVPGSLDETVDFLAARRLLTLSGVEGAESRVDLAHESLITAWPTLQTWVSERREAEQIRRRLEASAAEWVRLGRGRGGQLDEVELTEAERWLQSADARDLGYDRCLTELVQTSRSSLDASRKEREASQARELEAARHLTEEQRRRAEDRSRAARRLQVLTAILLVALLAACGLFVYGTVQGQLAKQQAALALSRQLAAQALYRLGSKEDLALLLSVQAYRLVPTAEARSAELTALEFNPPLVRFLLGHTNAVTSAQFSPDGRTLATAGNDSTIRLWDVSDPRAATAIGQLTGHTSAVTSVAFSPDGRTLASASRDNSIRLWDVSNPRGAAPIGIALTGHTAAVTGVAFSPDGRTLASASRDDTVRLWDVTNPRAASPVGQPVIGHSSAVAGVAFSPDGTILASASYDNTVRLWDISNTRAVVPVGQPLAGHSAAVTSVAFSPAGNIMATSSSDNTVRLWDVANPRTASPLGQPLTGHTSAVTSVAFSADGEMLASGAFDRSIRLWDVSSPQLPTQIGQPLTGHADAVNGVAFKPRSETLASASNDNTIRLWDVKLRVPIAFDQPLIGHADTVNSIAFSPDGATLASASNDATIRLWDVGNPRAASPVGEPLEGHTGAVTSLAFSHDGTILASAGRDTTIRLWNVASRAAATPIGQPLTGHTDVVNSVVFSPDDKTLASVGGSARGSSTDTAIHLWDISNPSLAEPIGQLRDGQGSPVTSLAFSPDHRTLASGSSDAIVRLWDVRNPRTAVPIGAPLIGHSAAVTSVAFSADGRILASASRDNTIRLWDVTNPLSPTPLGGPITGHTGSVTSVAFSPDGRTLASASSDDTVRLWDISNAVTAVPIGQPLTGHSAVVTSVAFSSDGMTLASAGDDKTVRLWDVGSDSWRQRACQIADRNLSQAEWTAAMGSNAAYERTCPDIPPGDGKVDVAADSYTARP